MEDKLIKMLSSNLECIDCRIKDDTIIMDIKSSKDVIKCPYCGSATYRVHSTYTREIQDIPLQDKRTILLINTRKMFCDNHECTHKTFSEPFEFVKPKAKKTNRLIDRILISSVKLSSVSAQTLLKSSNIQVSKSSICELLKKMPSIVDKSYVTKICVDDFAFRKRYTYGSVMVDLESHRIIDMIDSRETKEVEKWLATYPNIQVISRDGAQTYASAATNAHPKTIQVSDRFHLLKNLSEAMEKLCVDYIHQD